MLYSLAHCYYNYLLNNCQVTGDESWAHQRSAILGLWPGLGPGPACEEKWTCAHVGVETQVTVLHGGISWTTTH